MLPWRRGPSRAARAGRADSEAEADGVGSQFFFFGSQKSFFGTQRNFFGIPIKKNWDLERNPNLESAILFSLFHLGVPSPFVLFRQQNVV